ncbi:2OG-Fe(II) oxygenase family protein [Acetobacter fallax]|uniref:2OG-Fe(II) oxygenase n=1 Tax=Acetobacter fallax TaxID=1737473 RepID=A0ABX0KF64_9PROT|nr:2OG-Fe(II) oxygenase [Acetobacter fallax]NHO32567.1 2OG-Fe(II) oxygenase [Acetobacter fallax]NHO36088.1 2OG-Fe(II) oxygenase [Acetobacter fallax]
MATASVHPDYAALRSAPVATDPFPYVVVPDFIRPDDLKALHVSMPEITSGGSFPPGALTLSPLVKNLIAQMEGPELRALIAEKFDLDLHDAPAMLTLRGRTREKDGRIHRDSTAKRVTVLLYLNPPGAAFGRQEGCLRLLRGPDDVENYAVEVPPINGTLLVFPNCATSWHGHRRYVGPRYTIQLNYMETGSKARSEMRRHKLSALAKRLPFAA